MTAIVAANFLMFALFAAAGYFAFRHLEDRITARTRKIANHARASAKAAREESRILREHVERLDAAVRKTKGLPGFQPDMFAKMEDRHEQALSRVVTVNDQEVLTPAAAAAAPRG